MESETFKTRVLSLVQKSRRALRLYTAAASTAGIKVEVLSRELSAVQVQEWRNANTVLLTKLGEACDRPNNKELVYEVFALRNEFQALWRSAEAETVTGQRELVAASERGDFIRAASLAVKLSCLKARVQAGQAAHHELDTLIKRTRVSQPLQSHQHGDEEGAIQTIQLLDSQVVADPEPDFFGQEPKLVASGGKVIPLRRR
jgi:hypothetical protein